VRLNRDARVLMIELAGGFVGGIMTHEVGALDQDVLGEKITLSARCLDCEECHVPVVAVQHPEHLPSCVVGDELNGPVK
jgi:hypothetical protein